MIDIRLRTRSALALGLALGLVLGLALVLTLAAPAASAAVQAALTARDKADIARVEAYLNGIETLKGRFLQIGPDGALAKGRVYMRRPGRLRFDYDPPSPLVIVADRVWLILRDRELDETSRLPLSSTPISVLVADRIRLGERTTVERIERQPGSLRLTLRDKENPEQGAITLVFSDDPLELRSWIVTDAQGLDTSVALSNVEKNVPLDPKLFVVLEPVGDSGN